MTDHIALDLETPSAALPNAAASLLSPPGGKLCLKRTLHPADRDDVRIGVTIPLHQEGGGGPITLTVSLDGAGAAVNLELPQWLIHQPERLQMVTDAAVHVLEDKAHAPKIAKLHPQSSPDLAPCLTSPFSPVPWPEAALIGFGRLPPMEAGGEDGLLVLQPLVVSQWHPNACGHHALFNARQLLVAARALAAGSTPPDSVLSALSDEPLLWREVCISLRQLEAHATSSGLWNVGSIRNGTLDECHIRHLIEAHGADRGRDGSGGCDSGSYGGSGNGGAAASSVEPGSVLGVGSSGQSGSHEELSVLSSARSGLPDAIRTSLRRLAAGDCTIAAGGGGEGSSRCCAFVLGVETHWVAAGDALCVS